VLGSVQLAADDPNRIDGLGDVYHVSGVAWRGGFGRAADARPAGDREIFAACFAAALVYGEDYRALGGLDASFFCYHEDVDFGFRHRLAGGRAVLVADAVVLHEGSGTTGRYSSFTVYHGIRNRLITFAKNMPTPLLPLALPAFLGFGIVFLIRSFMLGIGRDYCRGIAGGLLRLRAALRSRRDIQRNRKISALTALRAMRVSPLAPLRRAPDLRPINPPSAPRPHQ
jgi:GT2 family glycosyltransferase